MPHETEDEALAARLAAESVALLRTLRDQVGLDTPAHLKAEGDRRSHDHLVAALAAERPLDAVLSEEGVDDAARLSAARVWIVDPLDGTREYGEGRLDWAVHVALWERTRADRSGLAAAAVGLADGTTLTTSAPPPPPVPHDGPPRVLASRTRPPAIVGDVVAALAGTAVPMGSAGAKISAVVRGEAEVYVHAGGQYEWDSAAPVAVALAAGVHATRLDGSPLRYNEPTPYLPDLLVCRPDLADRVLSVVAR